MDDHDDNNDNDHQMVNQVEHPSTKTIVTSKSMYALGETRTRKRQNQLAKTACSRTAEPPQMLVPNAVPNKRKRLGSEALIPQCSPQGVADMATADSAAVPNMISFSVM
jgi:hypothetical protein